jgi:hypothetical protein
MTSIFCNKIRDLLMQDPASMAIPKIPTRMHPSGCRKIL